MSSLNIFSYASFQESLRAPAVPLVAHDPYFSIWSPSNKLAESDTSHWTGSKNRLSATISIDGEPYRLMGKSPSDISAMSQVGLKVLPTRTIYSYEGAGIHLDMTFMTPAIPSDLDLLSRPLTYILFDAHSIDTKKHTLRIAFGANGELASQARDQEFVTTSSTSDSVSTVSLGSVEQPVLAHRGDWTTIDWGYMYLSAKGEYLDSITAFKGQDAKLELVMKPIEVHLKPANRWLMLSYDDLYSIQYFKQNLRPYWRRNGDNATTLIKKASENYSTIKTRCEAFDAELMTDLRAEGGEKYAQLCALAYRQCLAGNKLVADPKGQPLLFPKENTSNGCIATSDVIYPMAPQFLLFGPSLSRAMMVPIMDYAASSRWKFTFAPHDLGTYPQANGQVYGGGERTEENQMPVEESANMLILVAALAEMEGKPDFAVRYWSTLTKWANYLKDKGFDPDNQLCTDDFLGHLAHNVNLSSKAILGIASYARLCQMKGDLDSSIKFGALAKEFADRWVKEAADGDHFKLTFDKSNTWSQKYNLVWDKILNFGLFPNKVRRMEMDYYKKVIKPFGLPLDNRSAGAKLDWSLWTATLTQDPEDFAAIMNPVYDFVNKTPQRVGMGDWYDTSNSKHLFMHSRPVVGGVFLKMLYSKPLWTKWHGRDRQKASGWAKLPEPPLVKVVVPAADDKASEWQFTTQLPPDNWMNVNFDTSSWKRGLSGFGTSETPGSKVKTVWNSSDIWIRREFDLTADQFKDLKLWMHHDEAVEVFINGVLACTATAWTSQYEVFSLSEASKKALKVGRNTVAVHCHQTSGGQYVDLGFVKTSSK